MTEVEGFLITLINFVHLVRYYISSDYSPTPWSPIRARPLTTSEVMRVSTITCVCLQLASVVAHARNKGDDTRELPFIERSTIHQRTLKLAGFWFIFECIIKMLKTHELPINGTMASYEEYYEHKTNGWDTDGPIYHGWKGGPWVNNMNPHDETLAHEMKKKLRKDVLSGREWSASEIEEFFGEIYEDQGGVNGEGYPQWEVKHAVEVMADWLTSFLEFYDQEEGRKIILKGLVSYLEDKGVLEGGGVLAC